MDRPFRGILDSFRRNGSELCGLGDDPPQRSADSIGSAGALLLFLCFRRSRFFRSHGTIHGRSLGSCCVPLTLAEVDHN